jgi:hypothetical protein
MKTELKIDVKVQGTWKVRAACFVIEFLNKINLPFAKPDPKTLILDIDIKPRYE